MTPVPRSTGDPDVSVVMVTHNAWALTEQAIGALAENTEYPYELLLVDNASTDETRVRLAELPAAHIILNEQNRGFGPAVNQAAAHAQGEYLLLLNTDAFVHPGWLEPLREALERAHVGAAVPRYLNADGSLQEAGPVLAQDGTVVLYGDGDDPRRLCYRFRRVVDFGSAACMLIKRWAFVALGGFDEAYAPAYYEDADLGLRLAELGLKILYEPRSTVTHVRYGSGERELASQLSERNRQRFAERWASRLTGRPWSLRSPTDQMVIEARDAPATPRVLVRAPANDPAARRLVEGIAEHWPLARVTWNTGGKLPTSADLDRWLRIGVEIVDQSDCSWLDGRLFQFDVAVLGSDKSPQLIGELTRTQPQAVRMPLSELEGAFRAGTSQLEALLAQAGVAPPARTV